MAVQCRILMCPANLQMLQISGLWKSTGKLPNALHGLVKRQKKNCKAELLKSLRISCCISLTESFSFRGHHSESSLTEYISFNQIFLVYQGIPTASFSLAKSKIYTKCQIVLCVYKMCFIAHVGWPTTAAVMGIINSWLKTFWSVQTSDTGDSLLFFYIAHIWSDLILNLPQTFINLNGWQTTFVTYSKLNVLGIEWTVFAKLFVQIIN